MISDVYSVTSFFNICKWEIWVVFVGGEGVNGYVFVLWVFVIGSLNKGNIDMERDDFFYDVFRIFAL